MRLAGVRELTWIRDGLLELVDRLDAIIDALEADERSESTSAETRDAGKKKGRRVGSELETGDRVQVVIAGRYCGRCGTVLHRRGTMFWYLELDARYPGESKEVIYKMASSVKRI